MTKGFLLTGIHKAFVSSTYKIMVTTALTPVFSWGLNKFLPV